MFIVLEYWFDAADKGIIPKSGNILVRYLRVIKFHTQSPFKGVVVIEWLKSSNSKPRSAGREAY